MSPDLKRPPRPCGEAAALLERVAAALGGRVAVLAARNETVKAVASRTNLFEAWRFGEAVDFSHFNYERTVELDFDQLRMAITNHITFIIPQTLSYVQTIDGPHGFIDGNDRVLPAPAARRAMPASRLTANFRQADLTSPLRLIRQALLKPAAVRAVRNIVVPGGSQAVLRLAPPQGSPVLVFIDSRTHLPAMAAVLEDRPPLGDVLIEARFEDYRTTCGLELPFKVSVRAGDTEIYREDRTEICLDLPTDASFYAVPTELRIAFDPALARLGTRATQQLLDLEMIGFPQDAYVDPAGIASRFTEVAAGVQHIFGTTHSSLLIEMQDHLVLVEAPYSELRSAAVLAEIKRRFPSKPIRALVATHFHHDHTAGIRYFAAEDDVIVPASRESADFYRRAFSAPHTVAGDRLAGRSRHVEFRGVDRFAQLTDGRRVVELHNIANSHAADMLVVFLPQEKLLFVADLFKPVAALAGQPAVADFKLWAGELADEIDRLGLPIEHIYAVHGDGSAGTLADLRAAAGR